MPFIDLNKQHDRFEFPKADIIIVGAGTAGILLAVKLIEKGKSVLIIESGNFVETDEKQKLNSVEQTGKILKNAIWGRKRVIGGTTISWGGQSLPFTPIDFKERQWVPNSGWPISYQELDPYYKAADLFMDIDNMNYSTDIFPRIKLTDPGINASVFDFHVAKWTNNKNFYEQHQQILDEKILVIYNAQLTHIFKNYCNEINSIQISNFKFMNFVCPVNKLIITAGTIETIRLLLNNKLGNHSGCLGKYFMEHPCLEIGTIKTSNLFKLQKQFNTHVWKGRKYSVRLSLSEIYQQQNKILNCSASIMFKVPKGKQDIYSELKNLNKNFNLKTFLLLFKSIKTLVKCGKAYLMNNFYYKPDTIAILSLMIEQEPCESSFISLSINKDKFGISEPLIHWTITSKTWDTVIKTSSTLKKQIEDLDFGKVELYNYIDLNCLNWQDYLSDVCHNMGGCRMSELPENGVVDKNLQVWDIPNLFICSQAVFPTASHSNPVLTMLALGLRLVDHITNIDKNGNVEKSVEKIKNFKKSTSV